jgi:hypothetical protein
VVVLLDIMVATGKSTQFFNVESVITDFFTSHMTETAENGEYKHFISDSSADDMFSKLTELFVIENNDQRIEFKNHFMKTIIIPWNSKERKLDDIRVFLMLANQQLVDTENWMKYLKD